MDHESAAFINDIVKYLQNKENPSLILDEMAVREEKNPQFQFLYNPSHAGNGYFREMLLRKGVGTSVASTYKISPGLQVLGLKERNALKTFLYQLDGTKDKINQTYLILNEALTGVFYGYIAFQILGIVRPTFTEPEPHSTRSPSNLR